MHGFLIHTYEGTLLVRNYDYLKYDNPGWWGEHHRLISSFWEFDSEKPQEMKAIFHSLSRISRQGLLSVQEVKLFCQSINYDLEKFMAENATPEARFSKVAQQNWDHSDKSASTGFGSSSSSAIPSKSSGD